MISKITKSLSRRSFFASTGAAALTIGSAASARVGPSNTHSDFVYEVNRTEDEWLSMLTDEQFVIMREGYTESPKSGTLWDETRDGTYHCRGCDLHVYSASTKVVLDKGWVFFYHGEADAVLMDVDGVPPQYGGNGGMGAGAKLLTEVHCRRCGSHLGHFLIIKGKMTHCINDASLTFNLTAA